MISRKRSASVDAMRIERTAGSGAVIEWS